MKAINTIANRLGTFDPSITLPDIELDYGGTNSINDAMMSDIGRIIEYISDNYIVPQSFIEGQLVFK